jgi:hypothetical protein
VFSNIKWLSVFIVGLVLVLLTVGAIVRTVRTGEGLDPANATAAFALLGALVAGAIGTADNPKTPTEKKTENEEEDLEEE